MQKYLKNNNKGFTLVEVIVVAVIVLILAAVAIPLYNGYVRDTRVAAATNLAATVAKTVGTSISLGHYKTAAEACDDVGSGKFVADPAAVGTDHEVSVMWDATKWDVKCNSTNNAIDVQGQPSTSYAQVTLQSVPFAQ